MFSTSASLSLRFPGLKSAARWTGKRTALLHAQVRAAEHTDAVGEQEGAIVKQSSKDACPEHAGLGDTSEASP